MKCLKVLFISSSISLLQDIRLGGEIFTGVGKFYSSLSNRSSGANEEPEQVDEAGDSPKNW